MITKIIVKLLDLIFLAALFLFTSDYGFAIFFFITTVLAISLVIYLFYDAKNKDYS